jgi:hypothetical protein
MTQMHSTQNSKIAAKRYSKQKKVEVVKKMGACKNNKKNPSGKKE